MDGGVILNIYPLSLSSVPASPFMFFLFPSYSFTSFSSGSSSSSFSSFYAYVSSPFVSLYSFLYCPSSVHSSYSSSSSFSSFLCLLFYLPPLAYLPLRPPCLRASPSVSPLLLYSPSYTIPFLPFLFLLYFLFFLFCLFFIISSYLLSSPLSYLFFYFLPAPSLPCDILTSLLLFLLRHLPFISP